MNIIDISNCSDEVIIYINKLQNNYFELEKLYKEKEEEIQDLKQKNDYLNDLEASAVEYKELQNQLQQKENIIKEVREYIKETGQYLEDIKRFKVDVLEPNYLDILEILDKVD